MNMNNDPDKFPKRNLEIHMNQNRLSSIQSSFSCYCFHSFPFSYKDYDIPNSQYSTVSVQKIYSQYGNEYIEVRR